LLNQLLRFLWAFMPSVALLWFLVGNFRYSFDAKNSLEFFRRKYSFSWGAYFAALENLFLLASDVLSIFVCFANFDTLRFFVIRFSRYKQ